MKIEYHPRIRDLPLTERPRERLKAYGASNLSTAELLAIVLRTGSASENVLSLATAVLTKFQGLAGIAKASFEELHTYKGIGEAKVAQAKAALELGKRLLSLEAEERPVVKSPQDVANLLQGEMAFLEQEELRVVLLNTKNHVLSIPQVYRGSVHTSLIRVGELFREAVRANSPALIVVHNHPSGDPTPSPDDIQVTEQMIKAGELLDIEVVDHLILGGKKFVSLREQGLGFSAMKS